jgi:hypothetical protein
MISYRITWYHAYLDNIIDDIIYDINTKPLYHIWYNVLPIPCTTMLSLKIYDIIHDIIGFSWYHAQYHKKLLYYPFPALTIIDITHDNIAEIMEKGYDINIIGTQSNCITYDMVWYVPMILRLSESPMILPVSLISCHLCSEVTWVANATWKLHRVKFKFKLKHHTGSGPRVRV